MRGKKFERQISQWLIPKTPFPFSPKPPQQIFSFFRKMQIVPSPRRAFPLATFHHSRVPTAARTINTGLIQGKVPKIDPSLPHLSLSTLKVYVSPVESSQPHFAAHAAQRRNRTRSSHPSIRRGRICCPTSRASTMKCKLHPKQDKVRSRQRKEQSAIAY